MDTKQLSVISSNIMKSKTDLKRYKITITVTTRDSAFDTRIGVPIWKLLDVENGERLDSVSLPVELPLINYD